MCYAAVLKPFAPRFFSAAMLASAAASDMDGTRLMLAHVLMHSRFEEDRAAARVISCASLSNGFYIPHFPPSP